MKKASEYLLLGFLLLPITGVLGRQSESNLKPKFLIEGGIEYGGDEILEVFFTNGSSQTMKAGQGGFLAIGGQLEFEKLKSLMIRASIGIKYNTTAADDANIRLTRLPVVFIPFWNLNENFRIGVGVTGHQNVKFKGDGFIDDADFTSTVGPRFEFGYKWIALTYTSVNYKTDNGAKVDASSVGLSLSLAFPNK